MRFLRLGPMSLRVCAEWSERESGVMLFTPLPSALITSSETSSPVARPRSERIPVAFRLVTQDGETSLIVGNAGNVNSRCPEPSALEITITRLVGNLALVRNARPVGRPNRLAPVGLPITAAATRWCREAERYGCCVANAYHTQPLVVDTPADDVNPVGRPRNPCVEMRVSQNTARAAVS